MRIGIFGEISASGLSNQTKAAIAKVKELLESKDLNYSKERFCKQSLDLILVGKQEFGRIDLNALPCDSVFIYDKITGNDTVAMMCKAIEHYMDTYRPSLIIEARTEKSDIVVPFAANRLNASSFLDCIDVRYAKDSDDIVVQKSIYSGNATVHYKLSKCCIVAFRHSSKTIKNLIPKLTDVIYMEYQCECIETNDCIKTFEPVLSDGLIEADLVIVCGYGVGSKKEVERIADFARKIGAAIGGTKKIIDVGWLPIHQLIGQTGQMIAPKTCLTVGASGAMPFINGIIDSQQIIAINSDPDARIFNYADIGLVGDYSMIFNELESLVE